MSLLRQLQHGAVRLLGAHVAADREVLSSDPAVLKAGRRSHTRRVEVNGRGCIKKVFALHPSALEALRGERRAHEEFGGRPWMSPWVRSGRFWFAREQFPEEARLDRLAARLSAPARLEVARRALIIALDIYAHGYVHRDLHARNLFVIGEQLKLTDFETLIAYPEPRPLFAESYDITGRGLVSPFRTGNMGLAAEHASGQGVFQILGVNMPQVMAGAPERLKEMLRAAAATFESAGRRHSCRAGRIYSAFSLPGLSVARDEAQRNCARRFEQLGIRREDLAGRRLLDLGCNVGGMLFHAQSFSPLESVGVEFDAGKLVVARMVAAFNNLPRVRFLHADIDRLSARALGGRFDAVFCLAVEAHVRRPARLYRLLGRLAAATVFFEGNSTTDWKHSQRRLLAAGFRQVDFVGFSDDDCIPANNNRPLLLARR